MNASEHNVSKARQTKKLNTGARDRCSSRFVTVHLLGVSLEHALYLTVDCTQELYVRHSCWVPVFYKTVVEQGFSRIPSLEHMY